MRIVSELMSREIYQAQRGAPEALPAEVRVISRQTETCGRGRGSSRPNFLHPRTAAHRKSEPTHTQAHRSKRAHTCKRKKFLVATLGADPGDRPPATAAFSVQWWPAPGAHKRRPPREKERGRRGGEGTYTSLEARSPQADRHVCPVSRDLTLWAENCKKNTRICAALKQAIWGRIQLYLEDQLCFVILKKSGSSWKTHERHIGHILILYNYINESEM